MKKNVLKEGNNSVEVTKSMEPRRIPTPEEVASKVSMHSGRDSPYHKRTGPYSFKDKDFYITTDRTKAQQERYDISKKYRDKYKAIKAEKRKNNSKMLLWGKYLENPEKYRQEFKKHRARIQGKLIIGPIETE